MSKIVVTHLKADFDALASAVAACRLFGCDSIVVSTEMEPSVATFLQNTAMDLPIVRVKPKEIEEFPHIDHLIITDCKQSKRLGNLSALIDSSDKITIFDHHPAYAKDIETADSRISTYGACTTAVVRELIDSNIAITPADATLYLLGVYEDTGLLTFSSTTAEDVLIVAELMARGGDVSIITDYVKRELSREQVFVLNELLINMTFMKVGDVLVTYSYASIDEYIEELAFLAHRMIDMEGLEVLFIVVRSGPRVVLVGRSKDPRVDVSRIVAKFGGGGHASAASANIKDLDLHEAVEILITTLREQIAPVRFVREIMNSPAKSLNSSDSFNDAMQFTSMHNLNHVPVVKNSKTVGIISHKEILQGMKHGLTELPVEQLMQVEIETVTPDTQFAEAEEILLNYNQKLLPVEQNGKLVGVVTRTDLLRIMHEESIKRSTYEEGTKARMGLSRTRNVQDILLTELTPAYFSYLKEISEIAAEEGVSLYMVGGFVRDLMMGFTGVDMDLVVEGDAIRIAAVYAKKNKGKLTIHDKYKTASVTLPSDDKIDFATARTEYYSNPGAAPVVEFSSLKSDLSRRDFTINAMAIQIDGDNFGQLVDFFGGQRDLLDKKIRVLHSMSFIDDPTRAFRALRFAARLGFMLGSHTERLMKHASSVGLFSKIAGGKLFVELKYILMEDRYYEALTLLKKYDMLDCIYPKLAIYEDKKQQFKFLDELWRECMPNLSKGAQIWRVRFVILMMDLTPADFKSALESLRIEETTAAKLLDIYNRSRYTTKKLRMLKSFKPSELYSIFSKHNDEELMMIGVHLGEKRVSLLMGYIQTYRDIKIELTGDDLKNMGIPPSKEMGKLLTELLFAKLDGVIADRAQEEEYVRQKLENNKKA
ncbi:MAG: CBS domain-containing protein [Deferribacteraceae bacterium]|nr:CBS domain-containing protein [Deferribacteraceae bacterium]